MVLRATIRLRRQLSVSGHWLCTGNTRLTWGGVGSWGDTIQHGGSRASTPRTAIR